LVLAVLAEQFQRILPCLDGLQSASPEAQMVTFQSFLSECLEVPLWASGSAEVTLPETAADMDLFDTE